MRAKFEVYQGGDGHWYWHMKSGNGRIVATGGEGYVTVNSLARTLRHIFFPTVYWHDANKALVEAKTRPEVLLP